MTDFRKEQAEKINFVAEISEKSKLNRFHSKLGC